MRQDRNPKPRPPGFRNNLNVGRDPFNSNSGGNSGGNSFNSGNSNSSFNRGSSGGGYRDNRDSGRAPFSRSPNSRPPQSRPPAPKRRRAPGPAPIAKTPDRWKEARAMLKAAAWRLGKLVHKSPAAIIVAEDPFLFIQVPDIRARQLAKKIMRLRKVRPASDQKA
jgi:hypothetical protein